MERERRKFMRFNIPLAVEFKSAADRSGSSTGTTINFSRSGLCFEASSLNYDQNDLMELQVKMPMQDSFISVTGDLTWIKKSGSGCLAGLSFRQIDSEAKNDILDHAYEAWLSDMRKQ